MHQYETKEGWTERLISQRIDDSNPQFFLFDNHKLGGPIPTLQTHPEFIILLISYSCIPLGFNYSTYFVYVYTKTHHYTQ